MYTTTRRLVVTVAVAAVAMAGTFTALGATAASAADVSTATQAVWGVRLDQPETTAAAASLAAAEDICNRRVMPWALLFHTAEEMMYPVCQVAVHVCARQANEQDELAAIAFYADSFACSTWVQGG